MERSESIVAVFTPTYNRGYILGNLYQSLVKQTSGNFYWLIVDDGSNDNTEDLVKAWIKEDKIKIEYYRTENSGKSAAVNFALNVIKGELFFCVDSDDFLKDNAIETIEKCYEQLDSRFVGILAGRKNHETGEYITQFMGRKDRGGLRDLYYGKNIGGDTALIYKTEFIKKYRFPVFENEKFVPESYLYDLLDQDGELFLLKEYIYMANYLKDGYTNKMKEVIYHNPNGYYAYIEQRLRLEDGFYHIFLDNIRCITINIVRNQKKILTGTRRNFLLPMAVPAAAVYFFKTFYRYRKGNGNTI